MVFISQHSGQDVWIIVTSAFFSLFSMQCHADVSIYSLLDNQVIAGGYKACGSKFGAPIDPDGFKGYLLYNGSSDGYGCIPENISQSPNPEDTIGWILLLRRGNCTFVQKVLNAQNKGYDMVIVFNNGSEVEPMRGRDASQIFIPSAFVSFHTGTVLRQKYQYFNSVFLIVTDDSSFPFDFNTDLLIPFAVVVAVCVITMISFMVCKCIRDRRRARRHRLPASSLRKIPIEKFSSKTNRYETCAICLEDYVDGERLRILPCNHAYHSKCIDPWLTRNRRVCPVCKRKVFAADEVPVEGSDSDLDSDNERTPLVSSDTPQLIQTRRLFLLSSESMFSHFGWTTPNASNSSSSTSSYGSNHSGYMGDRENEILAASIICSINSAAVDSTPNTSVNSNQAPGTSSLQLQLPVPDYQDVQSRNHASS